MNSTEVFFTSASHPSTHCDQRVNRNFSKRRTCSLSIVSYPSPVNPILLHLRPPLMWLLDRLLPDIIVTLSRV